jgi:hypothetical protein
MKKVLRNIAITLIVLAALSAILNQFTETSLNTEIEINGSTEQVWSTFMDHDEYPNWNPFLKEITGSTSVGDNIKVTMQTEGNDPMLFEPVVLVNTENQEFRWIGKLFVKGFFDGEHVFTLEAMEPGKTKFVQRENFTGLFAGLFMRLIGEDTKVGFVAMNEALKSQVESKQP